MISLKTALLIALILAVTYQHAAALRPVNPMECCYEYRNGRRLAMQGIRSYYKTPRDCYLDAVVLVMKDGRMTCVNPQERWVKRIMRLVQEKK